MDPYAIKFENTYKQISAIRKPNHVYFDLVLTVVIIILATLCLQLLYMKGYIQDYHHTNLPT